MSSSALQLFFGGPFETIVEDLLKLLGLGGAPRDAATLRIGELLSHSSVPRIAQLGRAIYWAASAYGRILSSPKDNARFFVPAISATASDLKLTPSQRELLDQAIYSDSAPALALLDLEITGRPRGLLPCDSGYHRVGTVCRPCDQDPDINPCPPIPVGKPKPSVSRLVQRIEQELYSLARTVACDSSAFLRILERAIQIGAYAESIFTGEPIGFIEGLLTKTEFAVLRSLAEKLCKKPKPPNGGKPPVAAACVNTHKVSSAVQGPGVCCKTMPADVRAHPAPGERWAATDKRGKCFVCEIKTNKDGSLGFKRGKSAGLCATTKHGCCSLLA